MVDNSARRGVVSVWVAGNGRGRIDVLVMLGRETKERAED
jgi:hypothetical protein